jgi:transcriptional regulator with XRE-family HTH domain
VKRKPKRRRLDGPIHARLAELREQHNLTQEQVASVVGVDKTAVSHWETGVARPDVSHLPALASLFTTTIEDLVEGEGGSLGVLGAAISEAKAS